MRNIVLSAGDVGTKIMTSTFRPVTMGVGAPTICALCVGFAPGVIAAVVGGALVLRMVGVNVAARPFGATGQTEINHVWVVVVGTSKI